MKRIEMMKCMGLIVVFALSVVINGCRSPEEVAMTETKRETLARHETKAKFLGVEERVCRGMTALCPDRCGHSGSLARFEVVEYIRFDSFSEFGKKQEQFSFLLKDNMGHVKMDDAIIKTVEQLSPGDLVLLSWNHDYVTRNGGTGPERPVNKLEKINSPAGKE